MSTQARLPLLVLATGTVGFAVASWAKPAPNEPVAGGASHAEADHQAVPAPANRHSGGLVAFDVRDADTDARIPCKLTFVGLAGTPRPFFTHNDIGRPEGELAIAAFDRVFSAAGSEDIRVPQGTYNIYVSRGPEWDISVHPWEKIGEGTTKIYARLRHVIDSRGWLSADFHVHAAPSPDSIVPLSHRVLEFVADGIDMIVSTDHNVVTDYAPSIKALGLGSHITSARGDELTTNGWGHFGAFPLSQDHARAGQGAILVHGHNAKEIFANVREHAPEAVIDVHHPRIDPGIGYFILGQFDPHSDRAGRPGFSFDFDAIEVLNGYQDPARKSVDRIIDDWLGLLNHGHLVTATGNSDTHHLTYNMGGYPRNYVRVTDDRPDHVTPQEVATAVKNHHVFFTTGPFVRFHAGKGDIGDLVPAPGGKANLDIEVDAAPWISVSRVILYVSGKEAKRWPIPESQEVVRFRVRYEINLAGDGYAVVRVDGDKIMAPVVGDNRNFGVYPLALTNPIFFDVNGNGRYDPEHAHGPH
ncbi:MAG TPA: CehA/McbA family metallohydrolase [Polyangia bacterium]